MRNHNDKQVLFRIARSATIGAITVMLAVPMIARAQISIGEQQQRPVPADQQRQTVPPQPKADIQIGTYDPQIAFEQHPARKELLASLESVQADMQSAQQEGSQQKVQQLQQQFERKRSQLIAKFQRDVTRALPDAARDAGVDVVALEVAYMSHNIETKDITNELIQAFQNNGDADGSDASPALPSIPGAR